MKWGRAQAYRRFSRPGGGRSPEKGESSKPFESALGFHIAQAIEEPAIATPTFEEARGRLASEARGEAQAKLLEKLRSEMTVRVHEDRLAAEK